MPPTGYRRFSRQTASPDSLAWSFTPLSGATWTVSRSSALRATSWRLVRHPLRRDRSPGCASNWPARTSRPPFVLRSGQVERSNCWHVFTPTAPSFVGSDRRDPGFAYLFGQDLGHILADQHACVPSPDLDGWLPPTPNWPRPEDLPHLHHMVHDSELLRGMDLALERRADLKWPDDRRVLIHGDLDRDQVLLLNAVAAIGFLAF